MAGDCVDRSFPGDGSMGDEDCFRDNTFSASGGDSARFPDCFYCFEGIGNSNGAPCTLAFAPPGRANCSAGAAANTPTATRGQVMVPGFRVTPVTPDCLDDVSPFFMNSRAIDLVFGAPTLVNARGTPKFYLRPTLDINIDPCHPDITQTGGAGGDFFAGDNQAYCCFEADGDPVPGCSGAGSSFPFWACRVFSHYMGIGWTIQCVRPINVERWIEGEQRPPAQTIQTGNRLFGFGVDRNKMGFIHASVGARPGCFQTLDLFCLQSSCGGDPLTRVWGCDGALGSEESGDRASAWRKIRFDPAVSVSTDNDVHPNPTGYVDTINDAWSTFRNLQDDWQFAGLAQVGSNEAASTANEWTGGYTFDEAGIPPGTAISTFPVVRPDGDASRDPVAISIKSRLTSLVIPARWHIQAWSGSMSLTLEPGPILASDDPSYRIGAVILFALTMRVRPIDNADNRALVDAYGFGLFDADAFWAEGDMRIRSKDDATAEHAHESLWPVGPDGERVTHNRAGAQTALTDGLLLWRGIIGPEPYAVGDYEFRNDSPAGVSYTCCDAMYRVHGSCIPGEVNDFSDPAGTQRYTGDVVITIADIANGIFQCLGGT